MKSVMLFFLLTGSAVGHDYYIDSNGSDETGTGEQEAPWRTIEHAFATIDECDANIWLTAGQTHTFTTIHWNNLLPPVLGGWDECDDGGTWQFSGLDGVATLTSNSPFPFDISKSSNPGWPVIDPEVRNKLVLKDLDFQAGPNVLALAIPAAGDFLAVNLTSDARLVFGYGGDDPATENRTIEIVDSHIAPTANTRALHVRFAASVIVQNSQLTSTLSAIFLEDLVRVVTIRDGSMLTACPNSRVIDGNSVFNPYDGCTISVTDSTVMGNGFLGVPGLRPVVELTNVQCCNCSSNCVLDGCQIIGGAGTNCCGILGEEIDLDDYEQFEPCLLGPEAGIAPGSECYDFIPDDGLDLRDFAEFQRMFGGP